MELDVQQLNFIVGVVIPLLVGVLAKQRASAGLKAILNFGLSAVAGAITTAVEADGNIVAAEFVTGIGMTWLTSIVSYYGLWKPTEVADKVSEATAAVGIGREIEADTVTATKVKAETVEADKVKAGSVEAEVLSETGQASEGDLEASYGHADRLAEQVAQSEVSVAERARKRPTPKKGKGG